MVAAARAGEEWALEAFVLRYQAPVRALARRLAPGPDAYDLAQESFVQAAGLSLAWMGRYVVAALCATKAVCSGVRWRVGRYEVMA